MPESKVYGEVTPVKMPSEIWLGWACEKIEQPQTKKQMTSDLIREQLGVTNENKN